MPPLLALGVSPRSAEQRKRTRPVPGRRRVCPSSGIPGCAGTQARLWRTPCRCRCGSPPPPPCSPVRLARSTARRCSGRSPALPSPPRRSPFRWSLAVRHAQPAGSRIVTPPAAPRAHAHAHARGLAEDAPQTALAAQHQAQDTRGGPGGRRARAPCGRASWNSVPWPGACPIAAAGGRHPPSGRLPPSPRRFSSLLISLTMPARRGGE